MYLSSTGSKNATDCLACDAGKFLLDAGGSDGEFVIRSTGTCGDDGFEPIPSGLVCNASKRFLGGALTCGTATSACTSTSKCVCQTKSRQRHDMASLCKNCPQGFSQENSSSAGCIACVAGRYGDETNSSACKACAAGTFSDNTTVRVSESVCQNCIAGKYSDEGEAQTSADTCKACKAGTYSIAGEMQTSATVCTNCTQGKYSDGGEAQTSADTCKACKAGTYSTAGEMQTTANVCTNCTRGKASAAVGANMSSSCEECVDGKFTELTGQVSCKFCPGGYVQSDPGQDYCSACSVTEKEVNNECLTCPNATYQDEAAKTVCKACGAGQFNDKDTGVTACVECEFVSCLFVMFSWLFFLVGFIFLTLSAIYFIIFLSPPPPPPRSAPPPLDYSKHEMHPLSHTRARAHTHTLYQAPRANTKRAQEQRARTARPGNSATATPKSSRGARFAGPVRTKNLMGFIFATAAVRACTFPARVQKTRQTASLATRESSCSTPAAVTASL